MRHRDARRRPVRRTARTPVAPASTSSAEELERYCRTISRNIAAATVIPFLGAGANLCGRPQGVDWLRDGYFPNGRELTSHFVEKYEYPPNEDRTLIRVSQYVDLINGGEADLFADLRTVFRPSREPTELHRFLATQPRCHREKRLPPPWKMILTTNYDDMLERAFAKAEEPVDVVYYHALPRQSGMFMHLRPDGVRAPINSHTEYREFALGERPVILKLHGQRDADDADEDSYVITEDHYVAYLAQNIPKLLPASLMRTMKKSHFLFLGYSLGDWNMRAVLHYVWTEQKRGRGSWAIQRSPNLMDRKSWGRSNVEIVGASLESWLATMRRVQA
jgi:hypothetical protein